MFHWLWFLILVSWFQRSRQVNTWECWWPRQQCEPLLLLSAAGWCSLPTVSPLASPPSSWPSPQPRPPCSFALSPPNTNNYHIQRVHWHSLLVCGFLSDTRPEIVPRLLRSITELVVEVKYGWVKKEGLLAIQISQKPCLPHYGRSPAKGSPVACGSPTKAVLTPESRSSQPFWACITGDVWQQYWLQPKKLLSPPHWTKDGPEFQNSTSAFSLKLLTRLQEFWHSCAKVDKPLRPTPPICSQFLLKETKMGGWGAGGRYVLSE